MNIKIYIRTSEPWSNSLENFLQKRHVAYSKVDVSIDPWGFAEMMRLSGQKRVPVAVIEGQVVVGYQPIKLDELLTPSQIE